MSIFVYGFLVWKVFSRCPRQNNCVLIGRKHLSFAAKLIVPCLASTVVIQCCLLIHLNPDDHLPTCLAYTVFTARFQGPFLRVQESIKESHLSGFHSSKHKNTSLTIPHRSYCWQQAKLISIAGNSSHLNSARVFFFILYMMLYLSNMYKLEQSQRRRCFVRGESIFQSCSYLSSQLAFKSLVTWENWKRSCDNNRKSWIQQQRTHCSSWTWRGGDWELHWSWWGLFCLGWDFLSG